MEQNISSCAFTSLFRTSCVASIAILQYIAIPVSEILTPVSFHVSIKKLGKLTGMQWHSQG